MKNQRVKPTNKIFDIPHNIIATIYSYEISVLQGPRIQIFHDISIHMPLATSVLKNNFND